MLSSVQLSIAGAFGELGLSVRMVFPEPEIILRFYADHVWRIVRKEPYTAVNAIPGESVMEDSFWEAWHSVGGGPVAHHVLFAKRPPVHHDIFEPPAEYDGLHPEEILGRKWYVVEDPSMLAWAYRSFSCRAGPNDSSSCV